MIPLLKRIFCFVLAILIPIALFPVSALAVGEELYTDTVVKYAIMATDVYGEYYNLTTSYTNFTDAGAVSAVTDLYNEYASSASDPMTLAALGAALLAAGSLAVIYDAVTGQGYVQFYQEQYINSLDGYWDYTLNDLGFARGQDDLYYWLSEAGVVAPVLVTSAPWFLPVAYFSSKPSVSSLESNGTLVGFNSSNVAYYVGSDSSDSWACLYDQGSGTYGVLVISRSSTPSNGHLYYGYHGTSSVGSNYLSNFSNGRRYAAYTPGINSSWSVNTALPVFASQAAALTGFSSNTDYYQISIEPSVYIGDSVSESDLIPLPDPDSPDYVPKPIVINTDIQWDDSWGTVAANPTPGVSYRVTDASILNSAIPDIFSQMVQNQISVDSPPSDPGGDPGGDTGGASEVFVPLLPVTLPDFDFSLSGIWYYVVQWVQSIGSWVSMMFQVWATLPYAMVVPVYATAVIVIVLGVYKRFFM